MLEKGAKTNATTSDGSTPLHWAANAEVAKLVLDRGADIEARNNWGQAPLSRAALLGLNDVVRLLLARGAKIQDKDHYASSALLEAASGGRGGTVLLLLGQGSDVHDKDTKYGKPVLHWAAIWGQADVLSLALQKGADLDARDNEGLTPLLLAADNGKVEGLSYCWRRELYARP